MCDEDNSDCDVDVDEILNSFDKNVQSERRFLNETKYPLCKSGRLYVAIGLSTIRGFFPAVRITGAKGTNLSFLRTEWNQIVNKKTQIEKHLFHSSKKKKFNEEGGQEDYKPIIGVDNNCVIYFGQTISSRWIRIEKNKSKIVLSKKNYETLTNLFQLIDQIESIRIITFYNILQSMFGGSG